jgi:hypothetical protein
VLRRDRACIIVFAVLFATLGLFFALFARQSLTGARLPIGIVNLDRVTGTDGLTSTAQSQAFISRVSNIPALSVVESSDDSGVDYFADDLASGALLCVFVVNPGFEEHLLTGRTDGSLTLIERSGSTRGILISDIVAGELADTLSEVKALSTLHAIDGFADYPQEDYVAY